MTDVEAHMATSCCYRSTAGYPQTVQFSIMFRSLQVRAMHKGHIYTRNPSLVHAYVATLMAAFLAVGICDS